MTVTMQEFSTGTNLKVTTVGVDVYLSVMRLGLMLSVTRFGANMSFETSEDFNFFKTFDPNNRPALTEALEPWIEDCKRVALERFYLRLNPTLDVPSSVPEAPAMAEANKITEEVTKAKRSRALKAVAPITEEPQTPAVKEPEVKEEPKAAEPSTQQAEVVSAPEAQPEAFVKYNAKDKEQAKWLQTKLDALDPNWKRDARAIEQAKALVKVIDGVQITHINGKESQGFLSTLEAFWKSKDMSVWTR